MDFFKGAQKLGQSAVFSQILPKLKRKNSPFFIIIKIHNKYLCCVESLN